VRRPLLLALGLCAAAAPAGAEQALTRWTVDGGGGRSQNARWTLTGTVGQPDAAPLLYGARYSVGGGFWTDLQPRIFHDGFEGSDP
jgi:hypothetical protein